MPTTGDLYSEFLDIPPGPRPPNHYALLLLPNFEPDTAVIHEAVLSQNAKLRRWALHPDRETANRIQEMLNEIGRAGFILEDPKTRADYDRGLARELGVEPPEAAPAVEPPAPAPPVPQAARVPALTCPSCGGPAKPGDAFCSACGRRLSQESGLETALPAREARRAAAERIRGLRRKRAALVVGATLAALAAGFLVYRAARREGGPGPVTVDPRLTEARAAWQAAVAKADAALLAKHVPEEWAAARQKAADAKARADAGDTGAAIALFQEATEAFGAAGRRAMAKVVSQQVMQLHGRFRAAMARKDPGAAGAVIAQIAKLAPEDPGLPGWRRELEALQKSTPNVAQPKGPAEATPPPFQFYKDWPFDAAEARKRQQETARALGAKVEDEVNLGKGVQLTLVLIPAGEFMMGSPGGEQGRFENEDLHRVTIDRPFWMGKNEVTQEQWGAVMGGNPSAFKAAKNPVERVSWDDVQGFLKKLSGRQGGGFALPTEAQWEYACRAGTSTRFSFGNEDGQFGEYAWYSQNSQSTTHWVGQKTPNAWGLRDMHGNLWEWCASPYQETYDGSEQKGAEAGGNRRVLRGGSWLMLPRSCRSAVRVWFVPDDPYLNFFGFRVVRSARISEAPAGVTERPTIGPLPTRPSEAKREGEETVPKAEQRPKVYTGWPFGAAEAKRRQEETAQAMGVKVEEHVDLGKGVQLTLVLVPAGGFMMGSPPGELDRGGNEDVHRVTIDKPFWMGKYEVTQEQWEAVMGDNPSRFKGGKNPVESVSWNEIQGFLKKLNGGPGGPFALPTEAQWEYACRAGSAGRFCFGDVDGELGAYGWYSGNARNASQPVGQMTANAWGLHDLHGNVDEWCGSPYQSRYDGSEQKGAEAAGVLQVLRGGSWSCFPRYCRSAYRNRLEPEYRSVYLGFRVVRSARTF